MTTSARRLAVLNTRPRAQAAELTRLLEQAGFEAVEAPAIEVVPGWDALELASLRQELVAGAFDWVVLPSQNAGTPLVDVLSQARLVCGQQTARALGLQPAFGLDRFSAAAALDVLRPRVLAGQRILVPHGAEGRDDLIEGLVGLGAVVDAPIAYRTLPVGVSSLRATASRLPRGEISALTLCSPSAVQAVLAAFGREVLDGVALVCLGETTAQAVREAGLRADRVAERTTMAALVEAVATCLVEVAA